MSCKRSILSYSGFCFTSSFIKMMTLMLVLANLNTAYHLSTAADLMIAAVAFVWNIDGYMIGRR